MQSVGTTAGLLLVIAGAGMPTQAAQLKGAVARVDITPPAGLDMWGFAARKGPSMGTLDPLYARVLVLDAKEKRVAIITLGLGRSFEPASLERLESSVPTRCAAIMVARVPQPGSRWVRVSGWWITRWFGFMRCWGS